MGKSLMNKLATYFRNGDYQELVTELMHPCKTCSIPIPELLFNFPLLGGFQQQQPMSGPGARHMAPKAGGRPPKPVASPHAEERQQANQQKPRVPELEQHLVNQLSTEEINSLNSKFKEATEADKKLVFSLLV
ncbi:hypothetical protein C1H46_025244 [Malus baccata]|uniref:Uncharacterized protein n=1 Tax=Malus baccata TaxID=106549 RepID=A0A540LSA2_MALBA|nr:hypothetical protein C1H46_025244 [Malus baccata]